MPDDKKDLVKGIRQRRLNSLIERFLPQDTEGAVTMSPVMGMTKYLKASSEAGKKIPDIASRLKETENFKQAMKYLGFGNIGEKFAARYPRIAAHMNIEPLLDQPENYYGRTYPEHSFNLENPTKARIALKPDLGIADTLAHEGTHTAQMLGSGGSERFSRLYEAGDTAAGKVFGKDRSYLGNPYEVSARRAGSRFQDRLQGLIPEPPVSATKRASALVSELEPGTPERVNLASMIRRMGR